MSRRQSAGENHNVKAAEKLLENMTEFIYFGTAIKSVLLSRRK
jgi:hypothetical protein